MKFYFFCLILFASISHAKVFNIDNQSSGTYIKGNYGLTNIGSNAYTRSSGEQTLFNDEPEFNWGGEVGFIFPQKGVNIRVGLEVIHPQKVNASGKNEAGAELLSVESSIYGVFPVLHLEYTGLKSSWGRAYFSVGGGYGKVILSNKYNLTAAGTALYSVNDYTEKGTQYTYLLETAVGYEMFFAGSNTIVFDLGYRQVVADSLDHEETVTTLNGNVTAGDPVTDPNEKSREFDLGGVFAGIGLRFYFNF